MTFPQRLRAAVAMQEKSIKTICAEVGIERGTWYSWTGKQASIPNFNTLFKLADSLNVTARWLATGQGPRERLLKDFDQEQLDLAMTWPNLPEATKESVRVLINAAVAAQVPTLRPSYTAVDKDAQKRADATLEGAQERAQDASLGESI